MKMKKIILLISLFSMFILITACSQEPDRLPFMPQPGPGGSPPPEMRFDVRTNMEILTPFQPRHLMHSRLQPGPLTEFTPSDGFGMLLPYSMPVTLDGGGLREIAFGLVTADGVVVTDPVFDSIERAWVWTPGARVYKPVYWLSINYSSGMAFSPRARHALVALDGSWSTPFDYVEISFTDYVIFAMRDFETFDIDVFDYNGRLLYNMLELDWIDQSRYGRDIPPMNMLWDASEGFAFAGMRDGTVSVMDVFTGEIRPTEFNGGFSFSNGLAAVIKNVVQDNQTVELWGFINTDLETVIPPQFARVMGRFDQGGIVAAVSVDGTEQIINSRGEILYTAAPGRAIQLFFGEGGFSVHRMSDWSLQALYTSDITPAPLFERLLEQNEIIRADYLWNGVFTATFENQTIIFTQEAQLAVPGFWSVSPVSSEYFVFSNMDEEGMYSGVMNMAGDEIVPREHGITVSAVIDDGGVEAFIINSANIWAWEIGAQFAPSNFKLAATDGSIIASGQGFLRYDESLGMFSVLTSDHFTWLDKNMNPIVSIPFMSNTMD